MQIASSINKDIARQAFQLSACALSLNIAFSVCVEMKNYRLV